MCLNINKDFIIFPSGFYNCLCGLCANHSFLIHSSCFTYSDLSDSNLSLDLLKLSKRFYPSAMACQAPRSPLACFSVFLLKIIFTNTIRWSFLSSSLLAFTVFLTQKLIHSLQKTWKIQKYRKSNKNQLC